MISTLDELNAALKDRKVFAEKVTTPQEFYEIIKQFPEHTSRIIDYALSDHAEFIRLVRNVRNLIPIAKAVPAMQDKLFDYVLTKVFHKFVQPGDLELLTKELPEHAETLISYVLQHPREFNRLIENYRTLINLGKLLPHMVTELLGPLSKPAVFSQLVNTNYELIYLIAAFPTQARLLIKYVQSTPEIFLNIFSDSYKLIHFCRQLQELFPKEEANAFIDALINYMLSKPTIGEQLLISNRIINFTDEFPQKEHDLINYITANSTVFLQYVNHSFLEKLVERFPQHASKLIHCMTSDPIVFKTIAGIPTPDLRRLVKLLPQQQSTQLIDYVISDPLVFKQIVDGVSSLNSLLSSFPKQTKTLCLGFITSEPEIFNDLVQDIADLDGLLLTFPEQANRLIRYVRSNPSVLNHLVKTDQDQTTLDTLSMEVSRTEADKAFTTGAIQGAFASPTAPTRNLPTDLSEYLGTFFDKSDASKMPILKKQAASRAHDVQDEKKKEQAAAEQAASSKVKKT